jgi:hypothetical protein
MIFEDYQFASGQDYSGLEIDWSVFGQGREMGVPGGAGLGASGVDGEPQANPQGDVMDSVQQNFKDGAHVEILANADMYAEQPPVPFEPLSDTAEQELA